MLGEDSDDDSDDEDGISVEDKKLMVLSIGGRKNEFPL